MQVFKKWFLTVFVCAVVAGAANAAVPQFVFAQAQRGASASAIDVDADGQPVSDKLPTFGSAGGFIKAVSRGGYGPGAVNNTITLQSVLGTLLRAALTLLGAIFLIMMVYGGYNWMTDRGEAEQVKKAKDTINRAIIGLIIVLGAYAITNFVTNALTTAVGA